MSNQITTAMVEQFSANVMHLAQQDGSRLRQYCRVESQHAESAFWDRIGETSMQRKDGRASDVIYTDTPHSRRMNVLEKWYNADTVDKLDKLKVIMNPESEYAIAFGMALGRKFDDKVIEGGLGSANGGKGGTQVIPLPDSQKVAAFVTAETTGSKLNIDTLRAVRKKFKQAEAMKMGGKAIFAYSAAQADDLLGTTEVTSSDFNSVKALVDGDVDTYMGFKFVETELLPFNDSNITYNTSTGSVGAGTGTITAAEGRRCMAFISGSAILCASPEEVNGRVDELPGKHYTNQVYSSLTIGTTRMEEVQVIEVICKEV